jgi:hypothetical protein
MSAIALPQDYAFDGLARLLADARTFTTSATLGGDSMGRMNLASASANLTLTLPPVANWTGHLIWFRFDGLTSNALATVKGNASENIVHGYKIANTRIYCKGEECCLYCDGSKWIVMHETLAEVYCRVYINTAQSCADSSYTIIHFDTVVADNGNFWDAVNYRFTPKVPGIYIAEGSLSSSSILADTKSFRVFLSISNSISPACYQNTRVGNASNPYSQAAAQLSLNGSTNYVDTQLWHDNGSAMTINASSRNYMNVYRVARETA